MIDPVGIITESWNYLIVICLMMGGLFVVISQNNMVKKLVGLAIFQTSVFLFYITVGKVAGGTAPILMKSTHVAYSNPLPHVLILTAIVVGVSTSALALALTVRIMDKYGTIEEDEIEKLEAEDQAKNQERLS